MEKTWRQIPVDSVETFTFFAFDRIGVRLNLKLPDGVMDPFPSGAVYSLSLDLADRLLADLVKCIAHMRSENAKLRESGAN